jgi:hypothetical protein
LGLDTKGGDTWLGCHDIMSSMAFIVLAVGTAASMLLSQIISTASIAILAVMMMMIRINIVIKKWLCSR